MADLERWDALTDEQRERVSLHMALAMQNLAAMGQEAADVLRRWAEETMPTIQAVLKAMLDLQTDLEQIKEQGNEPAHIYPGRVGNGRSLRAPKHAGLRDNRK